MLALLPLSEQTSIRLLRNMFRRNRLPVAGFAVVHVVGRSEGGNVALKAGIKFDAGREYWMNGVALATVARLISQRRGVETGVHSLASAVDPVAFVVELQKAGIELTESSEPCG
jgi:hypothetical protein